MNIMSCLYNIHARAFLVAQISQKELARLAELDEDTLIGFKESPPQWIESKNPTAQTLLKLEKASERL